MCTSFISCNVTVISILFQDIICSNKRSRHNFRENVLVDRKTDNVSNLYTQLSYDTFKIKTVLILSIIHLWELIT